MGRLITARALFDSTIVIDALRGIRPAVAVLDAHEDRAISIITWIEVLAGVIPTHEATTTALLRSFKRLELTAEVTEATIFVRRRTRLKIPDAIILASAEVENRVLLTRDGRDFGRLSDERIVIPYRL